MIFLNHGLIEKGIGIVNEIIISSNLDNLQIFKI